MNKVFDGFGKPREAKGQTLKLGAQFVEQERLEALDCAMIWEMESFSIPTGYDEGGEPPRYRIVLQTKRAAAECENLNDIARAVSRIDFPMASFFGLFPSQVARMMAFLAGLTRPVQNNDLFSSVESAYV